jgi:hypothetical protein
MNSKRAKMAQLILAVVDKEIIDIFSFVSIRPIKGSHRKRVRAQQITDMNLRNTYLHTKIPRKYDCRNPVTYNYL